MTSYNLKWPSIKGHILLWEEFCPQFPWVGPLAYKNEDIPTDGGATTNYLGEYWDTSDEIQTVHFRQFGWTVDGDNEGIESKCYFSVTWTARPVRTRTDGPAVHEPVWILSKFTIIVLSKSVNKLKVTTVPSISWIQLVSFLISFMTSFWRNTCDVILVT